MNLIKIAQKLQHYINSKDISDIYEIFKKDKNINEIMKRLETMTGKATSPGSRSGGDQTIKLCFLVWGFKNNMNPQELLNRLEIEMFAFSLVEFNDYDPDITCGNCGGDGTERCDSCSGTGNVKCETCDGEGRFDSEEEEEGEVECGDCNGSGDQSCYWCDGDGTQNCSECDGAGNYTSEDHTSYEISYFVSIDSDLKDKLTLMDGTYVPMSHELFSKILLNSLMIGKDVVDADNHMSETGSVDKKYRGEIHLNEFADVMDYEIKKYGTNFYIGDIEDLNRHFYK